MKITRTVDGTSMAVALEGRLDTESAPELEAALLDKMGQIEKLTMDFSGVEYISSAGLRVLIKLRRRLKFGGELVVTNANPLVVEAFNLTGMDNIINLA